MEFYIVLCTNYSFMVEISMLLKYFGGYMQPFSARVTGREEKFQPGEWHGLSSGQLSAYILWY